MQEHFFDAAVRNWQDACILEDAGEYDNAVCLHGFAAECALKTILQEGISREFAIKYGHDIDLLFKDILSFSANDIEIVSILDPSFGLRLAGIHLEDILFSDHPTRRYFEDAHYNRNDAVKCRENALAYIREILRLYIDGYIKNV